MMPLDMPGFPIIRTAGIDGMLVSFGDRLSEPANRAAIAFRAEVARAGLDGVEETSSSLVSCYLRFDPLHLSHADLEARLRQMLDGRDWLAAEGKALLDRMPALYDATARDPKARIGLPCIETK